MKRYCGEHERNSPLFGKEDIEPAVQQRRKWGSITANSEFTASWIRRYWNREAKVVYSVGENMRPAAEKRRWILHTGRFVAPGHADDKHQRAMPDAFRSLSNLHAEGWELHFAGSVLPDPASACAARELQSMSAGLPVCFHLNAPFEELRTLYRDSAVYWHATGLGSLPDRDPHRQEQFGITAVEAMSADAVPVVINRGGQRETVTHGKNGFVWDSLDEPGNFTRQVARDEALRQRLSREAASSAERFSRAAFLERVENLVLACLEKGSQGPTCASV